jgi:hypothetical protein
LIDSSAFGKHLLADSLSVEEISDRIPQFHLVDA